jgi:hypothetical protein
MDPFEKMERKREAQRRLRAQRQRAGRLRGRVVATSLIAFVLLWAVVFAQMATGNDPVLGGSVSLSASSKTATKKAAAKRREETDPRLVAREEEEAQLAREEAAEEAQLAREEAEFYGEEFVPETVEPQAGEEELVEVEPEPEPAPLTTSQS